MVFPLVVKPFNEGSSVEVYICNIKNFKKNLNKLHHYKEVMIEEYIGGGEIQVAIMGKKTWSNRISAKKKIL